MKTNLFTHYDIEERHLLEMLLDKKPGTYYILVSYRTIGTIEWKTDWFRFSVFDDSEFVGSWIDEEWRFDCLDCIYHDILSEKAFVDYYGFRKEK